MRIQAAVLNRTTARIFNIKWLFYVPSAQVYITASTKCMAS